MVLPGLPPGETEPPPGARGPVLTVAARTGPGTGVDQVTLTEGRWADGPGEVVLAAGGDFRVPVGDTLTMGQGSDTQDVTVVGLARSVSDTADAWMTPGGLAALPAKSSGYQMLYRLDDASTASRVGDARDAVAATLPDGAVVSARSWLVVKKEANSQTSLFVPFLLTFGGLSLLLSVLIVGTVVAGAVGLDDPPHRDPEGARLHPVPSGEGVRRPGAAARGGGGGAGCRRRQPGRGAVAGGHRGPLRHGRPDDRALGGRRRARRRAGGGHRHRIGRRGPRGAALGRGRTRGRPDADRRPRAVRRAGRRATAAAPAGDPRARPSVQRTGPRGGDGPRHRVRCRGRHARGRAGHVAEPDPGRRRPLGRRPGRRRVRRRRTRGCAAHAEAGHGAGDGTGARRPGRGRGRAGRRSPAPRTGWGTPSRTWSCRG